MLCDVHRGFGKALTAHASGQRTSGASEHSRERAWAVAAYMASARAAACWLTPPGPAMTELLRGLGDSCRIGLGDPALLSRGCIRSTDMDLASGERDCLRNRDDDRGSMDMKSGNATHHPSSRADAFIAHSC